MDTKKTQEPGMDDSQAAADRHGWEIDPAMPVGRNVQRGVMQAGGMEVGNQYDQDPLGEDYKDVTYVDSDPIGSGSGRVAPDASQPVRTDAGNTVASAPQTRTSYKP